MKNKFFCRRAPRRQATSRAAFSVFGALFCGIALLGFADDRPPLAPEDLKMTSEPLAPGAPAIILYRQVDRDDRSDLGHEDHFLRIKILKDEGRRYADVEIPYRKGRGGQITHLWARTIRPDGSSVEFTGKAFDKSIFKAKGLRYMAKAFTLPDVQAGCIIEYSYRHVLTGGYVFDSHWILSNELFTREASFSLKPYHDPYGTMGLHWVSHLLPPGSAPPKRGPGDTVRMEIKNVPAFQVEDYMPPEDELKSRVDFSYTAYSENDAGAFWGEFGRAVNRSVENFVGKRSGTMAETIAQIISPNDHPEVKIQKIYERVQNLRNVSYEREKTTAEEKRGNEKLSSNADDVLKKGYGTDRQLTWLFLGLVRMAGPEAHPRTT